MGGPDSECKASEASLAEKDFVRTSFLRRSSPTEQARQERICIIDMEFKMTTAGAPKRASWQKDILTGD